MSGLLLGLLQQDPTGYIDCRPRAILLLARLVMHKACTVDYLYYSTANPWLQVKLLKMLQFFPPPSDPTLRGRLNEVSLDFLWIFWVFFPLCSSLFIIRFIVTLFLIFFE